MESKYSFKAKHEDKWYDVASIDFNNGKVNLNGADIIDLDDRNLELYINGEPLNSFVEYIRNNIIIGIKQLSKFDNVENVFVVPINLACMVVNNYIGKFDSRGMLN